MPHENSFNIELLYILIKVSELKSINKSSTALMMTQPAISKKIKQLEDYYDEQLFIRSSKGMELTSVGQRLYVRSKKIIKEFEDIHYSISTEAVHLDEIKLGSLDSISSTMYQKFFIKSFTSFKETLITNKIFELIAPFNDGNLDVILIDSAFRHDLIGTFEEIALFKEPYYLIYSKNNKEVEKLDITTLNATNLSHLNLLMYPKYCPIHQRIRQIYQKLGIVPPAIAEIDYSESTTTLVSHSDYVTILPKSLAINKVAQGMTNLSMKQLDSTFTRSVSLFAHDQKTIQLISQLLFDPE
ncbi:LysR family transcriptional regulator [Dellaglioa sp. L3N]